LNPLLKERAEGGLPRFRCIKVLAGTRLKKGNSLLLYNTATTFSALIAKRGAS